ncbi:MAG: DEAD/DEAH box helicase family protein, partial [Chloroflexota bacterium]
MLQLKDYQQRALEWLRDYFAECVRLDDADTAFYEITKRNFGQGIPYRPVAELRGLPYVCLRIPTGGGKTLVACHSIGVALKNLLNADRCVVLWLVPSNAIREQTLRALKNRRHPYRLALEETLGSVTILDIGDALYVQRPTLDTETTVIVSTMQAFRVEETEGRKVYEEAGALMGHFQNLPDDILRALDRRDNGEPIYSLANVLRLRRPVVIVDEAHNARTDLSFDTLARFNPSCIVEFTATPNRESSPSNVLHSVSAAEL